jgi:hypothetical protein
MSTDPHRTAARLGFDANTVRRLQGRGFLHGLALTETAIRERLYRAHRAWLIAQSNGDEKGRKGMRSPEA